MDIFRKMLNRTEHSRVKMFKARALIYLLVPLALLSFFPAILSINRELGLIGSSDLEVRARKYELTKRGKEKDAPNAQEEATRPHVKPLDLLPSKIEDYKTQAWHKATGEKEVAEAIFQPDTEQATRITPYNCYVRISFHPSEQAAKKAIELSLKRYPVGKNKLKLEKLVATEAYEQDRMAYFLGWTTSNYAIEIDTSFIRAKHPGYTDHLLSSGREVAITVDRNVRNKLQEM